MKRSHGSVRNRTTGFFFRFAPVLALLTVSLLLGACGDDDNTPAYPQATVAAGAPAPASATAAYSITVGGEGVTSYKYNLDGADAGAYSAEIPVATPLGGTLADGQHTLKILGCNDQGLCQPASAATVVSWTIRVLNYTYDHQVGGSWTTTSEGQLGGGEGIAVDAAGNSYIVDSNNSRILKFAPDGSYLTTWGTLGSGDTELRYPKGITLDGSYLYVADWLNHRIVKYDYAGVFQAAWSTGASSYPSSLAYAGGILYVTRRGPAYAVLGYDSAGNEVIPQHLLDGNPMAVAVDSAGAVFVGCEDGRIYKLPADLSSVSTFYQDYVPLGLAGDTEGNLYVSFQNKNTVEKISPAGVHLATFGGGWSTAPGSFAAPKGVAIAGGSLYVAEMIRAQKLTLAGVSQLIYANLADDDGYLYGPQGLALDGSGNIYAADSYNHRIQKFANDGTFLAKWGGQGSGDGDFNFPHGLAFSPSGDLYVTDNRNDRVQKFSAAGAYLGQWGTTGTGDGELDGPTGIATDAAGNIYLSDSLNDRIQVFDNSGAFVRKWGTPGFAAEQMTEPDGIAVDPQGNVFVVQIETFFVQKFSALGAWLLSWAGSEGAGSDQLSYPYGLARDFGGNLYVADRNNYRVQKFAPDGTYLTTIGTGVRGSGAGAFGAPTGVRVDAAGNVYVADQGNSHIQVFRPD